MKRCLEIKYLKIEKMENIFKVIETFLGKNKKLKKEEKGKRDLQAQL